MILVTGATGHIGNVLIRELIRTGERVRALVLPGETCQPLEGLEVEIVEGDVLDPESLRKAFSDIRLAFHLAGIISIMPGENRIVLRVNVEGTENVLHAARDAGVSRLVYTSSIHAFYRAPQGITIDESLPFDSENPVGVYDRSKAQASLLVLEAVKQGLDAVIVCPTGVIGPHDYLESEMGTLIRDASESKPQIYVEGAYDFVDVRDVAQGMLLASKNGIAGEVYILSGEQITVKQLIDTVQEISGNRSVRLKFPLWLARLIAFYTPTYYTLTKSRPRFTPYSLKTITSNSVISSQKARNELGYAPRSLRQSIMDTVLWFANQKEMAVQKANHNHIP